MFKRLTTRELVFLSLLISLNIVLTRVASIRIAFGSIEGLRIGFGSFPTILAGIMFGPVGGCIVGALGDIIGYYINPMGPYVPYFTLSAALTGVIPALILMPFKRPVPKYWQLLLAIGIGEIITSVFLTPYFLQISFGIPMLATMPGRILSQVIQIPLYSSLVIVLLKRLPLEIGLISTRS